MKFKSSFELRDVCGEKVLIANGIENIDFGALVHMNATAADVFTHFQGKEFTLEEAVAHITSEYEVAADVAEQDLANLFAKLKESGIIAE